MIKAIKKTVTSLAMGAIMLSLSACGNVQIGEILTELDYVDIKVQENFRIIATDSEYNDYLLDQNGERIYQLKNYYYDDEYESTLIDENVYVYSRVLDDGRIEVCDESGAVIGTYAAIPEGYTAPDVTALLSEREILDIYGETKSCYYNKSVGDIVLETKGGLEAFNNVIPVTTKEFKRIEDEGETKFILIDMQENPIPGLEFENIHGFVKGGLAFGSKKADNTIWAIRRNGMCYETDLEDFSSNARQCLDSTIYYYPTFDCFGLTIYNDGRTKNVIIDREGHIISDNSNKTEIFKQISEKGVKIDKELLIAALNNDISSYNEREPYALDNGFILFPGYDTSEYSAYVFSYTTGEYTTIDPPENIDTINYDALPIDSEHVSTGYGVINMTTGELASDVPGAIAYDAINDVTYLNTDSILTSVDSNGKYEKYKGKCSGYIGDGKFIIQVKNKYYITKLF